MGKLLKARSNATKKTTRDVNWVCLKIGYTPILGHNHGDTYDQHSFLGGTIFSDKPNYCCGWEQPPSGT